MIHIRKELGQIKQGFNFTPLGKDRGWVFHLRIADVKCSLRYSPHFFPIFEVAAKTKETA